MTARLFLAPAPALDGAGAGGVVLLDGPEGRHAAAVVRVQPGDEVLVGDGAGRRAVGRVESADRHTVSVRLGPLQTQPAVDPQLVLVQALAKGGRDEQAIEAATELGVDVVVPWQAERCVARWRGDRIDKVDKGLASWRSLVVAAAKQSRRWWVPKVHALADDPAVASLLAGASLGLVLHEEAGMPLASVGLPTSGEIVVVVGPEGGITAAELERFTAAGGTPVRLGASVLRSSTAGPAALAVLSAMGRWR